MSDPEYHKNNFTGVEFAEFVAAISFLSVGGSGTDVSFKTLLQRLVRVSDPAIDAMHDLGIITKDDIPLLGESNG